MTTKEIKEFAAIARDLRTIDSQSPSIREASEKRRQEYLTLLQRLEERMDVLTPVERKIVRLRYINGLSVTVVARRENYSTRSIKRICSDALKKI